MSELKMAFGKRLRALRKQAGLSQEQLAEKIDMTIESVSNMERGIHGPKFETSEKIAKVLNIAVTELFTFK